MARKTKHDQREIPGGWVCEHCQLGVCEQCIDVQRVLFGATVMLCDCKRKDHSGEPADKQITDPETGTVWGPGLRVTQEGEIIRGGYESDGGNHG